MKRDFHGYTIYPNGDIKNEHGKILKQSIKNDIKNIRLVVNGKRRNFTISRLVYCVFNGIDIFELDKNQCISFKDGDKTNVNLDNLKLVYRGDLIQGSKHKSISKLTYKQVEEIKARYKETIDNRPINQHSESKGVYNSYRSLAKEYGVTYTLIKQIVEGLTRNEENYKL